MLNASKLLFGPAIVLFSIIASWGDIKEHKIRNSLILRIFMVSFVLNLVYFIKMPLASGLLIYLWYQAYYWGFSLLFFFLNFWKAGDVKFFIAVASLLHPQTDAQFAIPLAVFFVGSLAFVFFEGLISKSIKFKFRFSKTTLLTIVIAPFLSNFTPIFFVVAMIPMLLAKKFPAINEFAIPLCILMFLLFPMNTLRLLGTLLLYATFTSFKFKGKIPSAPFISLGFILSILWLP
ncbi:MAG: hypothetical protein GOV00_04345 [Candidatus Altiarchaeota archaeon]|nr:hypothetical protein [Candidatus Altiarchaeota archaeon]